MKEEILIKKVKRDDDLALRDLINQYEKMIYKIIHSFTLSQGDYCVSIDELFQEGRIGMYEACKTYNKQTNCKFSTFAYIVIKRKIGKALYRNLSIYKNESISIDKNIELQNCIAYESRCVEDNPIAYHNSEENDDTSKSNKDLSSIDRKIIRLRLEDYSYKEISKMLKISCKKIDNRLQYLKRRKKITDTN